MFYFTKCRMFLCLDENLPAMDWKTRYKIAVGIAKGLCYLHDGCPRRIIHRDIKASNVLLTSEYEAQVLHYQENKSKFRDLMLLLSSVFAFAFAYEEDLIACSV